MNLECPKCGTVYDVSAYPPGHKFDCTCGNTLTVSSTPPIAGTPFAAGKDTGLDAGLKVLLFFLNLCVTPVVGVVWYFVIRREKPRTAKDVCTFTWIPFVVWLVLIGLFVVLGVFSELYRPS